MTQHLREATPTLDRQAHMLPRRTNLPAPVTQLFGRDDDIASICELLTHARLVTLTGPGGIGKTQLALAVARQLAVRYIDGAVLVELAAISDPSMILPAIAAALGLWDTTSEPVERRLATYIADRHLLLVLDNAEHVLEAAPGIAALLASCPALDVLVTSRAPLHLQGEYVRSVLPLAFPPLRRTVHTSDLSAYPAVQLFIERVRASGVSLQLHDTDLRTIAEICSRLDGLPLAIELAAARSGVLTLYQLLNRLDQQLLVLTGGQRDQPARLQTMRNAITWSYDLLSEDQRMFFRRLSVFIGGWTLDAAASVGPPAPDALDALTALIESSLVHRSVDPDGEARFSMLEPIRQFAYEQLLAAGESAATRDRHADYYLGVVERAAPLHDSSEQKRCWDRLERDHDNLRAAQSWLLERSDTERGLRFVAAISWFWLYRGFIREGWTWTRSFLALPGAEARTLVRARALGEATQLLRHRGDYTEARSLGEEALSICEELGDRASQPRILIPLAIIADATGDDARRWMLLERLLATARELGDQANVARALLCLSTRRDDDQASNRLHDGLALARRINHQSTTALALSFLGTLHQQQGSFDAAEAAHRESLALYANLDIRWAVAIAYRRLASLAFVRADFDRSTRLYAAEVSVRATIGTVVPASERPTVDAQIEASRAALGPDAFCLAWEAGLSMALSDALAFALATVAQPSSDPVTSPSAHLTAREYDVLRLIAAGRSNKEIAGDLYLSVRTVERHITNLYSKIDARGRADATAWALRHDLA